MDSLYFNLNKGGLEIQVRNKPEDMIMRIIAMVSANLNFGAFKLKIF